MRNTILAIAIGVVCLVVAGVLGRVKEPHTAEHANPPLPRAEAEPSRPAEPDAAVDAAEPTDPAAPAPSEEEPL